MQNCTSKCLLANFNDIKKWKYTKNSSNSFSEYFHCALKSYYIVHMPH